MSRARLLGWIGAAAFVAIGLLNGTTVEGVLASAGGPPAFEGRSLQVDADPTPTPTPEATPTPSPTPTPSAAPTPTPSPTSEATPTPQPTPTPTPAPTPTGLVGYWEGTVVVGDDAPIRVGILLESCGTSGRSCGEITVLDGDEAGCSYDLRQLDPDDEGVFLPAEPPLAEDQLVYEVGSSCVDCSGSWLDGTRIYLRPTGDGGVEFTPVEWLDLVPIFSLVPASRPAPQPTMAVEVDTTTLVRGRELTVTVTGFLFAFVLIESRAGGDVPLGPVGLDEQGSGTLVATIPRDAPLGRADLFAEGTGLDRCEGGAVVRVTIVSAPGSATALPTPPETDTAASSAARLSDAWHLVLVACAGLIAGMYALRSHPTARSRRSTHARPGRSGAARR